MEARVRNVFWLKFMTTLNEPFISLFGTMITTKGFIYLALAFASLFMSIVSPSHGTSFYVRIIIAGIIAGVFCLFAISSESPMPLDIYLLLAIRYLFKLKGVRPSEEKKGKRRKPKSKKK